MNADSEAAGSASPAPPRFFGDAALRLAGAVPRLLGWHPRDFWDSTPAELAACLTPAEPTETPLSRTELDDLLKGMDDG
ncbi:phage tail assembly chaperone [Altericroceibacterium endophyticum]|uniref:Phage tail assembly chaperone n=1 Tax=Altericroceibacterium endophyticum TaxID=1808508 RepID=A0A6I4T415_9SPHN|nr:phage tail assembly chaperone [Altericroceibacterium endophyticum]MXO65498.1 phage tail assembly chaperone [Altericroceibacterium endophyticum]